MASPGKCNREVQPVMGPALLPMPAPCGGSHPALSPRSTSEPRAAHHQKHPQPQETGQRRTLLPPPRFVPVSLTRLPPALPSSIPPRASAARGDPAVKPQENDGAQGDPSGGHAGETPTLVLGTSPHPKREDRNQSRGRKPAPLPSHPSRLLHARRWEKKQPVCDVAKTRCFSSPRVEELPGSSSPLGPAQTTASTEMTSKTPCVAVALDVASFEAAISSAPRWLNPSESYAQQRGANRGCYEVPGLG